MWRFSRFFKIIPVFVLSCLAGNAFAEMHVADSLVRRGDSLHASYRFGEAREVYQEALRVIREDAVEDSAAVFHVTGRLLMAGNGYNMSRFARRPKVLERRRFSADDFFLYYPLEDRSWRKLPNRLDSSSPDGISRALYAPEWDEKIIFSASGADGARNIYVTEFSDTVWSAPVLAGEAVTSASDEIYPMLSPDGKTMYFASRGFYGIGGYDLYMSEWDSGKGEWSEPRNMGFPFSSPADDFLFVDSEDGRYSLFASNRECQGDSVYVYLLEREDFPLHVPVEDPDSLFSLSHLVPHERYESGQSDYDFHENDLTRRYMDKMSLVRSLRDSIADRSSSLEVLRTEFAFGNDIEVRAGLTDRILGLEAEIPRLQEMLDKANSELRDVELEFLKKGVFIDPDMDKGNASEDVPTDRFEFRRRSFGPSLDIEVASPEVKFDYSFMVLDEGRFAEEQTLPQGIIYQVQMYASSKKPDVNDLRGLSPVYLTRSSSGMHVCRVGRFTSFSDAEAAVGKVRRQGFRSAFVTACIDGKDVPVSKARAQEAGGREVPPLYQVRIVPASGELDASLVSEIALRTSGKDMARTESAGGSVVFIAGPFTDKATAEGLAAFVADFPGCDVSVELFGNEPANK